MYLLDDFIERLVRALISSDQTDRAIGVIEAHLNEAVQCLSSGSLMQKRGELYQITLSDNIASLFMNWFAGISVMLVTVPF